MLLSDLLTPDKIRVNAHAGSKKRLLEMISRLIADDGTELTERQVFESLCARERLGSTGLGHGIAIPHGRVSDSTRVRAAFMRLKKPVDFDALDDEPVDLLFALTVPEESSDDHLKLLAQIAELLSDDELVSKLRSAETPAILRDLLATSQHQASP